MPDEAAFKEPTREKLVSEDINAFCDASKFPELGDLYVVEQFLGKGGMGTVYKARCTTNGAIVAVKLLREELCEDLESMKRFNLEIEAVSKLDHPNMIRIHGASCTRDGAPYLVMDYVDGESLAKQIRDAGPVSSNDALLIFTELAEALKDAHSRGVIHRDVKPSNVILVNHADGSRSAKLVDFGIAKLMRMDSSQARETQEMTKTGDIFGTPSYMSPEQCLGFKVDHRSDIYSLGCLMYEVLSGKLPFPGENSIQSVIKQLNDEPEPWLTKRANAIEAGLQSIVLKCLEKNADDRFQSTEELLTALSKVNQGQKIEIKVKAKDPKAHLSLPQLVTFAGLGCASLIYTMPLMFGGAISTMIVFPVALIPVAYYLAKNRTKILSVQREKYKWSQLRAMTAIALGLTALPVFLASKGIFESLSSVVQYGLIAFYLLHLLLSGIFIMSLIGEFLFAKDKEVRLLPVAKKLALLSIPVIMLFLWLAPSMLIAAAASGISPTDDLLTKTKMDLPKFRETLFKTAMAVDSNNGLKQKYAEFLIAAGRPQEAVEYLNSVIPNSKNSKADLLIQRALAYGSLAKLDSALADIDAAIQLGTTKKISKISIGKAYEVRAIVKVQNNDASAVDDLTQAMRSEYSYGAKAESKLLNRSIAYWKAGKKSEAIQDLTAAIKIASGFGRADLLYLRRAILYRENGQPAEAAKDFQSAKKFLDETKSAYSAKNWFDFFDNKQAVRDELLTRSFVYKNCGENEIAQRYLREAPPGASKSDLLEELSKQYGIRVP